MRLSSYVLVALGLSVSDASATQLLTNPCFDLQFTRDDKGLHPTPPVEGPATGWTFINYSSVPPTVSFPLVEGGDEGCPVAQQIDVTALPRDTVRLVQTVELKARNTYQFIVWLSSPNGAAAYIHLQGADSPYAPIGAPRYAVLTPTPKPYVLKVAVSSNIRANAAIDVYRVGTVKIGKAMLIDVPRPAPTVASKVPKARFGFHVGGWQGNTLRNPNFLDPYDPVATPAVQPISPSISGSIARGWHENSQAQDVTIAYGKEMISRGGRSVPVQRVDVVDLRPSDGVPQPAMRLVQEVSVAPGHTYEFSVLLKGTPGKAVGIGILDAYTYWSYPAPPGGTDSGDVALKAGWNWYRVQGVIAPDAKNLTGTGVLQLIVSSTVPQTFWIGGARFVDKTTGKTVVDHVPWPAGVGDATNLTTRPMVRLWDSGTTWRDLEPRKDEWDFRLLDAWVRTALGHGTDIVMTLGQTPVWASSACTGPDAEHQTCTPRRTDCVSVAPSQGPGAAAFPKDIERWKNYVKVVSDRYKDRIRHWEIWNEPSSCEFFDGTPEELAQLTTAAAEILRSNPRNKILSPGFALFPSGREKPADYAPSFAAITTYLNALPSTSTIDVLAVHAYTELPEAAASLLAKARAIAKGYRAGLGFWETEGAAAATIPTGPRRAAILARRQLVALLFGAERFFWYVWGPEGFVCPNPDPLVTLPCVGTVDFLQPNRPPNAAGVGWSVLESWLVGARVTASDIYGHGIWRVSLTFADGSRGVIAWSIADASTSAHLPNGLQASVATGLDGVDVPLPKPNNVVTVTTSPTLFR